MSRFSMAKYRTLEVRVLNHGAKLTVIAKPGYYPMASDDAAHRRPSRSRSGGHDSLRRISER